MVHSRRYIFNTYESSASENNAKIHVIYSHSLDPDERAQDNFGPGTLLAQGTNTMDDAGSIYRELRQIAKIHRRKWSGNATLNTTALIHEAWLKLNPANADFNDKTHFFATAARAMRQVLINYAERNQAQKRCSPVLTEECNIFSDAAEVTLDELLFINDLLSRLEVQNPRACRILECRIFGGMTNEETACALDVSVSTVKREWLLLSTWLYHELNTNSDSNTNGSPDQLSEQQNTAHRESFKRA